MNCFIGPDGKEYDFGALPPQLVIEANELLYKTENVARLSFTLREGELPKRIADWNAAKAVVQDKRSNLARR